MNYRGSYNRGRYGRDEYGRDEYGRRGVKGTGRGRYRRGNYEGEDMLDEMYSNYGEYSEGKEEYNRGNYGAKQGTMKALEGMLESVVCFMAMLNENAESEEETQMIREYARQISEM